MIDPPLPVKNIKSHVVILGAGASSACCSVDINGRKLPIISDFIEILKLRPKLEEAGLYKPGENFEELYSRLYGNPKYINFIKELEKLIFDYFSKLQLPPKPTIYDHLILSLRDKDIILSFNWDPLLIQSIRRCQNFARLPTCLFLHGNVALGYCNKHSKISLGDRSNICKQCGSQLIDSKLLYPTAKKDYSSDPLIVSEWNRAKGEIKDCFLLTIFGYGAPDTDVEAIKLLKEAWGEVKDRAMEETEIIDIKSEEELMNKWAKFIHTHHYQIHQNFYDSMLGIFPRRSVEMMRKQLIDAEFVDTFSIPKNATWIELKEWIQPFIEQELANV